MEGQKRKWIFSPLNVRSEEEVENEYVIMTRWQKAAPNLKKASYAAVDGVINFNSDDGGDLLLATCGLITSQSFSQQLFLPFSCFLLLLSGFCAPICFPHFFPSSSTHYWQQRWQRRHSFLPFPPPPQQSSKAGEKSSWSSRRHLDEAPPLLSVHLWVLPTAKRLLLLQVNNFSIIPHFRLERCDSNSPFPRRGDEKQKSLWVATSIGLACVWR